MTFNSVSNFSRTRTRHAVFGGCCALAFVLGILVQFLLVYPFQHGLFLGLPEWALMTAIPAFVCASLLGSIAVRWFSWQSGVLVSIVVFVTYAPLYRSLVAIYTIG